jgi:uncharacterized membrane protein
MAIVACLVCAPPLASLLTSGLVAGVAVLALVAVVVVSGIAWGAWRLVREDAAGLADERAGGERAEAGR